MKRNKEEITKEYNEIALDLCQKHGILHEQSKRIKTDPGFVSLANSYYNQGHDAPSALSRAVQMYAPHATIDEKATMAMLISTLQIKAGIPKEEFASVMSKDPTGIVVNLRSMDRAIQEMRKDA